MTVTQGPGAENLNLENVTVQWVGSSGTYQIVEENASTSTGARFVTTAVKDADESMPVLNDRDDRFKMSFDLGGSDIGVTQGSEADFGSELEAGTTVDLELSTQSGASMTKTLVVPESLSGKTVVTL
jgi:archaellin